MCFGATEDLSWLGSAPVWLAPRLSSVGAEASCVCVSSWRGSASASPSGGSGMFTSVAVAGGGLASLGSVRTGELRAEGTLCSDGVGSAEGISSAGLWNIVKLSLG